MVSVPYLLTCLMIFQMSLGEQGSNFEDHHCRRQCFKGSAIKTCVYDFTVAWYTTMGRACLSCPVNATDCFRTDCILGSGTQRPVVTANRQYPGPAIEVCEGDTIMVTVHNELQNGESTSIHWHGILQRNSPFMDGVPMITQCPIIPSTSFTYTFQASEPGTYFWHSHSGVQRADGLAGPLIVRDRSDPHTDLYDVDDLTPLFLNDWWPAETAANRFSTHHYGDAENKPLHILVNGIWHKHGTEMPKYSANASLPDFPVPVPAFEYNLNASLRYRFRAISNAFMLCPISISIEGHNLVVIAVDGQPITPQSTRELIINSGERFDFIPYRPPNEYTSPTGQYWLNAVGLLDCVKYGARGTAKIIYSNGASPNTKTVREATNNQSFSIANHLNSVNSPTLWDNVGKEEPNNITAVQLDSVNVNPKIFGEPNVKLYLEMDFDTVDNPKLSPALGVRGSKVFTPRMNHITNKMPPAPLLTQPNDVPDSLFCNSSTRHCDPDKYCECIHVLDIPLGSLVEMVLIDNGQVFYPIANHPTHLHGYMFNLIGMDQIGRNFSVDKFKEADSLGKVKRKLNRPVFKDILTTPSGGYSIIRFYADNPGVWLMHCHIDYHMELGMTWALRVGPHQPPSNIPHGFPRCGSWGGARSDPATSPAAQTVNFTKVMLTSLVLHFAIATQF